MGKPIYKTLYAVMGIIWIMFGYKILSIYKTKQPKNLQTPSRQAVDGCQSFTIEEKERLLNGYGDQVHHRLLELIRCDWINHPGTGGLKLNHPEKTHFSQFKQSKLLDDFMEKKTAGFFVECGAYDGEFLSNTLFFERNRSWTGLLIEANRGNFRHLLERKRNAYSINACLNTENKTGKHIFDPTRLTGGVVSEMLPGHTKYIKSSRNTKVKVQCFPLYSIMKAMGRTHIDLFSLDVEGAEIGILKTIPFSDLFIGVLLVEYLVLGSKTAGKKRFEDIYNLMNSTGLYDFVGTNHGLDMLFVRKYIMDRVKLNEWKSKLRQN